MTRDEFTIEYMRTARFVFQKLERAMDARKHHDSVAAHASRSPGSAYLDEQAAKAKVLLNGEESNLEIALAEHASLVADALQQGIGP